MMLHALLLLLPGKMANMFPLGLSLFGRRSEGDGGKDAKAEAGRRGAPVRGHVHCSRLCFS